MKIGRYLGENQRETLGVVVGSSPTLKVIDLCAAARASGLAPSIPADMDSFIDAGDATLDAAKRVIEWASQQHLDAPWVRDESNTPWMTPLNVRNCIAGGRNFAAHREETLEYWKKQGAKLHTEMPMGFIKLAHVMVPTRAQVPRPPGTLWFDYEIEATAVIGKSVEGVSEEKALEAVFGYTILNDLSAREIQRKEMANQSILMGKNLPGLGPLGPWIVTRDEIPDPSVLELEMRVNGEVRQSADCQDLIFSFPAMVAYWSRMGLARGDLITTGSPEGVAIGRPDPLPYYLKPGDVVEAEVKQIGVLTTYIT